MTLKEVITRLQQLENPEKVTFKEKKFGIISKNALGIYMNDLNALAKEIGKDSNLAIALFQEDIYEAKLLAGKLFKPKDLTKELIHDWTNEFNNWEICDTFSMGIYAKSPWALFIISEYSLKEKEFEKRTAFATMAGYCMADKMANNEVFANFFPLLEKAASDNRTYVKKAVNWALRSIGKRNLDLKEEAIHFCHKLQTKSSISAQWIAKDALKELRSDKCRMSDYPRVKYRR